MGFEKWSVKKLGNVINLKRGYDLPLSKRKAGDIPILSSSGVSDFHNEFKVKGPGVTTGRSGLLGNVYYVEENFWPLNTSLYVEDFKGNDPKFIYYLLQTMNLENFNAGSSVPTLNRNHVHLLDVTIPDIETQKKIGQILYNFERKVMINNQTVKNLEELAQIIFQHWFIDFEFLNEQGEAYKSSGGQMKASELGEIPRNWEVEILGNVGEFVKGYSYKGKHLSESGAVMLNLGNFSIDGSFNFNKLKFYDDNSFKERHIVKPKEIVIANTDLTQNRAIIGNPLRVPNIGDITMFFSHHVTGIKNSSLPNNFLYGLFKTPSMRDRLKSFATGTTVLAIPNDGFVKAKFVKPDSQTLFAYNEIVESIFSKIDLLNNEVRNLNSLKETLLSKIFSREIELSDEIEATNHVSIP